jgi:2-polyprenyl-6-methoxyphenol hydroxylase-like FAD-dependent oxidoreductase
MYDVIVVGARVAGSATAMLLAGKGLRVLVVDRASFPSDTLSTHQVQLPGVARLRRWGLLDAVVASGAPPARHVRFDVGPAVLEGHFPTFQGVDAVYSPRRTVLDGLLVEAARAAGAEVRERFIVEELVVEGGRVTGIRGREKGGAPVAESARLTVGADGKHSLVARTVGAASHHDRPPLTVACYTYWDGVPLQGGELYARPRRAVGAWPTNDGLTMTYVAWPVEEYGPSGPTSRAASWAPWTWPATSASGSGPAAGPSGSGPAPTCPAMSAGLMGRAGPWSGTPAW